MALDMPAVLVAEDEALIRMMLCDALEEEGYRVFEASCVLEAVAILGKHAIDALITDIDMPGGLSGIDLAWLVERTCKNTAIIVVSGGDAHASEKLPARARFLPKPYNLEDITSILANTARRTDASTLGIAV
ncbi:response regulator [Rhizobium sp. P38BS-XIX]|uniref:response regulator n=1 Tax=Rhizobium sp. P38BS-XIX TaxID=2726740 RepID=UPI00145793F2|nr:response regulator [Rhizobium sp. P38BS-XIX]NLS00812.1 response regulator [Rhizobium sp. P38BS-XIX]